eukprot:g2818.t1
MSTLEEEAAAWSGATNSGTKSKGQNSSLPTARDAEDDSLEALRTPSPVADYEYQATLAQHSTNISRPKAQAGSKAHGASDAPVKFADVNDTLGADTVPEPQRTTSTMLTHRESLHLEHQSTENALMAIKDYVPVRYLPDSPFMERWDLIMLFLLAYTACITTYEIAFLESTAITFTNALFTCNRIVDLGFLCDIYVNFNLAYYDSENELITSVKHVRSHYLRTWFMLDIISMLPYGLFGSISEDESVQNMKSMRLIRLLRLIKLTRMLRASRIINRLLQKAYFKMSTWQFLNTFIILVIAFHWSSCLWMILANIEGADPNWQTPYKLSADDEYNTTAGYYYSSDSSGADASASGRLLKSRAGGGSEGDEAVQPAPDWYNLCGKYTLAIFGVWAFEPPEPYTALENWFTVALTVFAASFYAYLAGIIVELVYRRSEAARNINGKLDGLLTYLDEINFPAEKRARFKKFFWQIKPYFMHEYYRGLLPHLSPELNGELALFNHGKMFESVSWLNCNDDEEGRRFKTRLSAALNTHAYCSGEHIIVMALHFVIEGLVGFQLRLLRSGRVFGEMQCLSSACEPDTARSLTFTACAVISPKDFWAIMRTGQFPETHAQVRKSLALYKFKRTLLRVAISRKFENAQNAAAERRADREAKKTGSFRQAKKVAIGWRRNDMQLYRDMLVQLCRTNDVSEHRRLQRTYRLAVYGSEKALTVPADSKVEGKVVAARDQRPESMPHYGSNNNDGYGGGYGDGYDFNVPVVEEARRVEEADDQWAGEELDKPTKYTHQMLEELLALTTPSNSRVARGMKRNKSKSSSGGGGGGGGGSLPPPLAASLLR